MTDYLTKHGTKTTVQRKPMRKDQVKNNAGGYVWELDSFARLRRFLILGSEGGTYYQGERDLTSQNVDCIRECIDADGLKTVQIIVDISKGGNAPKNDPALFALAACISHGDTSTKRAAANALPEVARIGTHLYHFLTYAETMRGWGRVLKDAVANWYDSKPVDKLAYDAIKYRQRDGWSHRDVLRKAHAKSEVNAPIYDWITHGLAKKKDGVTNKKTALNGLSDYIIGYESAQVAVDAQHTSELIKTYNLPREALKTEHLNSVEVWHAMLEAGMPLNAMIRNLATMTRNDVFKDRKYLGIVLNSLKDRDYIKKSRVHPLNILFAEKTYASGQGFRGGNTWNPLPSITDALDDAFYLAFDNVVPTNKHTLLSLDVSGSMSWGNIAGTNITPREASAAMALVTMHVEPDVEIMGFGTKFQPINISRKSRLDDVLNITGRMGMSGTDCSLPFTWALKYSPTVENFAVYTDNETWAGSIHPKQALDQYRNKTGIRARSAVVGMTATGFSIADPTDPGMLDVVGFDTSAPAIMNEFFAGNL